MPVADMSSPSPSAIDLMINHAAAEQNIDPVIFRRLLMHESGGQANPGLGPAGEQGIGQFMPATAKAFGIDPMDPTQAIPAAAKYVRMNLNQFGGDYDKAIAGYGWGQGNVARQGMDAAPPQVKSFVDYVVRGQGPNRGGDTGNRGSGLRPAPVPLAQTIAPSTPPVTPGAPAPPPQQQVAQQYPMPPSWMPSNLAGSPLGGAPSSLADAFMQAARSGQPQQLT
jgi:hypothetical protein